MGHESAFEGNDGGPGLHLTRRQQQMVGCVAAGMTESEIAAHLAISPRTVRMHCDVVRVRLAVERRRQIPAAYREITGRDPLDLRKLAFTAVASVDGL
jgi:DNA-binding CsgD family transcriptional regulator